MDELVNVRRLPAQEERVETGPIMFGDDWPGLFIRGDEAFYLASMLRMVTRRPVDSNLALFSRHAVDGLIAMLESTNARNNDAFPAWREEKP